MKITEKQLRSVIREEIKRSRSLIKEAASKNDEYKALWDEYKSLKSSSKDYLEGEYKRFHRVSDTRELSKADLASDIMYGKHGKKWESAVEQKEQPRQRKLSSAQLMKQVTDELAKHGYKVTSRTRNRGSLKAWLVGPKPDMEALSKVLHGEYEPAMSRWNPAEINTPEFRVTEQLPEEDATLFVQVFGGERAEEERSGVDTTDLDNK